MPLALTGERLYIPADGHGKRDPRPTGDDRRRTADAPKIQSPADPIARGIGLDRPFFDDKNRAFWILQSIGWSGYFFLRSLSGFANSMGWMWLVHTLLLTATGYSLTLLLATLFRRLIKMQPLWTLVLSLAAVMLASTAFSVIETWSYATFLKPDLQARGRRISGRDPAQFLAARGVGGALLRDQLFPAAGGADQPARAARRPGVERAIGDAPLPAQSALPVQHPELHFDPGAAEANRARQCDAGALVIVPALHARQRADGEGHAGAGGGDFEAVPRNREDAVRRPAAPAFPGRAGDDRGAPAVAAPAAADRKRDQICGHPGRKRRRHLDQRDARGPGGAARGCRQWRRFGREMVASPSTGVGLANIRDRLSQAYGGTHRFDTKQNDKGGFSVILEIPYETGDKA